MVKRQASKLKIDLVLFFSSTFGGIVIPSDEARVRLKVQHLLAPPCAALAPQPT